ncbi:MAG TPA: prolyl oligopeptidase family serine peptidase [Candidatus Paceibacterota bacterium]|nr:prolyl oligopeptidase family serine peptidase [Candidatus Paceibacterota bacterium]
MHTLRTRIKKEIICEFLPPRKSSRNVVILCPGMPSQPGSKTVLEFLSRKGFWAFAPRYRGSWESGGRFLKKSPEKDILDMVGELHKGFRDAWSHKVYRIKNPSVFIIGSSFGGAAAILASRNSGIRKAVALSPVTTWAGLARKESVEAMERFTREAFGNGYRFDRRDLLKLKNDNFYSPIHEARSIDGNKILIIHAKDDRTVRAKNSIAFAKRTGSRLIIKNRGGHFSVSAIMEKNYWKIVKKFLGSRSER